MASFREHIGFGLLVAVILTGVFVLKSIVTGVGTTSALFAAIVIGSFMPDLDSDTSIVFSMIYSLFTSLVIGVVVYWTYLQYGLDWQAIATATATALVATWVVVRPICKKLTKHRGMFHSVPAAFIAGLLGFLLASYMETSDVVASWFGIGFALGYVTHLVLDEIHAGVNLDGTPFRPNKMLGTALKLYGGSAWANVFTYCLLVGLWVVILQNNYV